MSIGGLAWEWKTDAELFTLIGVAKRKATVLLDLRKMSEKHTASVMARHYEQCLDGLDDLLDVWCKPYLQGSVGVADGQETWWPELLEAQPTHKVEGLTSFSVLPIDGHGKPCGLSENCNLATRVEWVAGEPPRHSMREGKLCCDGVPLGENWKLEPCIKVVRG